MLKYKTFGKKQKRKSPDLRLSKTFLDLTPNEWSIRGKLSKIWHSKCNTFSLFFVSPSPIILTLSHFLDMILMFGICGVCLYPLLLFLPHWSLCSLPFKTWSISSAYNLLSPPPPPTNHIDLQTGQKIKVPICSIFPPSLFNCFHPLCFIFVFYIGFVIFLICWAFILLSLDFSIYLYFKNYPNIHM